MEDTLQPLTALQQFKPNKVLVLGIAASMILHLVSAFVLLGLPPGSPAPAPSITYIDLNAPQRPAPMTVPPKETAPPKVVRTPRTVPVPENPPQATREPARPSEAAPAVPPQETRVEEPRSHTTMGLGLTKGYFKSLRDGDTLRQDIKGYYLEMLQQINEKWWVDQQLDKRRLAPVVVSITVARNGEIIGSEIMSGSGNRSYDKAVLAALVAASPLPPLPPSYQGDFFQAPIRLVPPLNLMAW